MIRCRTNSSDGTRREMKGIEYIKVNVVAKLFTVQSVWPLDQNNDPCYMLCDRHWTNPLCVCVGGGWQQVELSCCVHPHANHGANNGTRTCLCRHCREDCWMFPELLGGGSPHFAKACDCGHKAYSFLFGWCWNCSPCRIFSFSHLWLGS